MTDETLVPATLFQLTGVGMVQTDLTTGRFVRANETFCELVGYTEAELRSMTYLELTHPDDRARDAASFAALQRRESSRVTSLTHCVRKDGGAVWLELHVTVIGEGDEAVNLTVVSDVTERRRADEVLKDLNETLEQRILERTRELRHSEQRFSQAFYANPIPACMTTLDRETFVEVNAAFLALTGYERNEVVGKSSHELEIWSSSEDLKKLGEAQQDGRDFRNLELGLLTKAREVKNILISAAVIRLDGHHGYLKMFYDVTEQRRTQEQMHRAIQEVMSDTGWFSSRVLERLAHIKTGSTEVLVPVELSKRERQVLERLAQGMGNDLIAKDLELSQQTIRNYISVIYDKLGVHSRAEAIVWARERGIVGE